MKTVSLDLHDFSILNNRFDLLFKLKEHYPDCKVSLFTIPYDYKREQATQHIYRKDALKLLKDNLDWLQIIPHGLMHIEREMEHCDYYTFRDGVIPGIKEAFEADGLPYVKGFCAPYWLWNKDVVKALDDKGWWGAIDRNQPNMLKTKRFYTYSHSLEETFWKSTNDVLKLHGHIDEVSRNDLEACFINLMKIDPKAKWKFATEFIET